MNYFDILKENNIIYKEQGYAIFFYHNGNVIENVNGKVADENSADIDFETREKYHDEVKLKTLAIEAIQKVGVAFGNNQQPTTTNWLFK